MKKVLTLSMLALMLAGGLVACSGEGGGTADPAAEEQQGVNITPPAESNTDSGAADSSDTGATNSGSETSDSGSTGESSDAAGSGDSPATGGDSSTADENNSSATNQ